MGGGRSRDLLLLAAAALASLALIAAPVDGLVRALALIPAVLLLPGYALAKAAFPFGRLPGDECLAYAITLSVAAAALGGLVWQLAFDLTRFAWACVLTAIALAGCAVAEYRRRTGLAQQTTDPGPRTVRTGAARRKPAALTAVALLVAAALAAGCVAIAAKGLREVRAESQFSALWVVPRGGSRGAEVGIWNHQGRVHEYRLTVEAVGRTVAAWRGSLGPRQEKQVVLAPGTFPPGARLVVSLYRDGSLYRRTELEPQGGA